MDDDLDSEEVSEQRASASLPDSVPRESEEERTASEKNKDLVHTTHWCENRYFWSENKSDLHENWFSHQLNCFHTKTNLFQVFQT
jgi:hypothetical protein